MSDSPVLWTSDDVQLVELFTDVPAHPLDVLLDLVQWRHLVDQMVDHERLVVVEIHRRFLREVDVTFTSLPSATVVAAR